MASDPVPPPDADPEHSSAASAGDAVPRGALVRVAVLFYAALLAAALIWSWLAGRWLLALCGAVGFAIAAAGLWWRGGVVPDPLVAGNAGPALLGGLAVLALLLHLLAIATSLAAPRTGDS